MSKLQHFQGEAERRRSRITIVPSVGGREPVAVEDRFWTKVDASGGPDACWLWTGARNSRGYGHLAVGHGMMRAHRLAVLLASDTDIAGQLVCHACDTPLCCNPTHLFVGSHRDNVLDCVRKGRHISLRGERHGSAKLSDADVSTIRELVRSGVAQKDVAVRFNIDQSHISRLVNGSRRKEVPS